MVLVFLVNNLGYNVTTIITVLGIGGIAVALAAQTVLGDFFSYFVIFFDRPFEIGDLIIVDDKVIGAIEYIGIKTTRIRAISGEQIVCSNKDLTDSRVHNYKKMMRRRVVFSIGVIYQTTAEQMKKIPGIIKSIIDATDNATSDQTTIFIWMRSKKFISNYCRLFKKKKLNLLIQRKHYLQQIHLLIRRKKKQTGQKEKMLRG